MANSSNKNIVGVIPARMGSTRFPGKPMANILGEPMVGRVYRNVDANPLVSLTIVATCDREIADYITSIGGTAILTRDDHERASDRCAEALEKVEIEIGKRFDIALMVQGDEPLIVSDMITEVLQPMINSDKILVSNLMGNIETENEFNDKNCIKVVCDLNGDALYYSRLPIPSSKLIKSQQVGKQVCAIPFRRDFISKYSGLEPTQLEVAESIDMLRVLEHGLKVRMIPTNTWSHSVDTQSDLEFVEEILKKTM